MMLHHTGSTVSVLLTVLSGRVWGSSGCGGVREGGGGRCSTQWLSGRGGVSSGCGGGGGEDYTPGV